MIRTIELFSLRNKTLLALPLQSTARDRLVVLAALDRLITLLYRSLSDASPAR